MNNCIDNFFNIFQACTSFTMVIVTLVYIIITYKTLKVARFQTSQSIKQNLQTQKLSLFKLKLDYLNMEKNIQISEALVKIESELKEIDKQLKGLP